MLVSRRLANIKAAATCTAGMKTSVPSGRRVASGRISANRQMHVTGEEKQAGTLHIQVPVSGRAGRDGVRPMVNRQVYTECASKGNHPTAPEPGLGKHVDVATGSRGQHGHCKGGVHLSHPTMDTATVMYG